VSDDPRSSSRIAAFRGGSERWMVAVRQVSEGVDIPRLAVCVWTTAYRTPLFFAQAIGRVVRARAPHETATVFLPAVRPLLALAAELEEQRNHVVRVRTPAPDGFDELDVEPVETRRLRGAEFTALDAEAEFAHVLHGGRAITAPAAGTAGTATTPVSGAGHRPDADATAAADDEFLGLPGLLTPEQTATLLATRDGALRRRALRAVADPQELDGGLWPAGGLSGPEESLAGPQAALGGTPATWREVQELRREVNRLVGRLAARTGRPHAQVHVEVRQAVAGPASASASIDTLLSRRDWLLNRLG
jgi:hypothetical protein